MGVFAWIELFCAALLVGCFCCFLMLFLRFARDKKHAFSLPVSPYSTRFAVIIPARNESRVIGANLDALLSCEYPADKYDIYVIVESMEDPTVEICRQYEHVHVFLRQSLDKQGKGYALDECIRDIFEKQIPYDAFLFLDADNIVTRGFLSRLNDAYCAGYDAGCGKRNNKDWNASVVSAASGLTFVAVNDLQNKPRTARGMSVVFSGTGFYVRAGVLKELGGWPFVSLTEDYEFSNFAMCQNLVTCYIEDAMYYDEQPLRLWPSIVQRTRWVKGFFCVNKKYAKQKRAHKRNTPQSKDAAAISLGTVPIFVVIFTLIVYLIVCAVFAIRAAWRADLAASPYLWRIAAVLFGLYFFLALGSAFLFYSDRAHIKISARRRLQAIFYHPLFLATYLISALRAFFIKDKWEVVEHTLGTDAVEL